MQLFLWYNVIVKKQTPQGYYTAYQLKLPVEIEKNEISDPVYSFSEVMDHIDLKKYLTIEERRPGRPRYDQKTLLKIIRGAALGRHKSQKAAPAGAFGRAIAVLIRKIPAKSCRVQTRKLTDIVSRK